MYIVVPARIVNDFLILHINNTCEGMFGQSNQFMPKYHVIGISKYSSEVPHII